VHKIDGALEDADSVVIATRWLAMTVFVFLFRTTHTLTNIPLLEPRKFISGCAQHRIKVDCSRSRLSLGVEMMNRTFWFAAFCLAGLGGVLATRVTASMAFSGESVLGPVMLGEGLAQDMPTMDTLAKDAPTLDALAKADRLDVAYLTVAAAMIPEAPIGSIAVPETKPGADLEVVSQRPAASRVNRTSVMLPRPRPRISLAKTSLAKTSLAKTSRSARPVVEVKTCFQPEGLSGLLMAFSGQPRCG
jgi:hypothetical protein